MGRGTARIPIVLGLAVLIGLLGAVPAAAVSRFAHPGGAGPPPCIAFEPPAAVCSIQTALAISSTPDDVTLLSGSYNVGGTLTVNSGVTMHGELGARPVINSTAGPSILVLGGTLKDVTLIQTDGLQPALMLTPGVAERVYVKTTAMVSPACSAGPGSPAGPVVIRDSTCWGANPDGAGVTAFAAGGGQALNLTLRNVTAVGQGPVSHGLSVFAAAAATAQAFATNVIASGATDVRAGAGLTESTNLQLDHSNYDTANEAGSNASVTDPGTATNVLSPPTFVNAANGDFRQTTASAGTIDLGTADPVNGINLGPFDLDGGLRTLGTAPDIGAYEGTASLPLPTTPGPSVTTSPLATPSPTTRKKCKKGRKLKRGKCVKRKKKRK